VRRTKQEAELTRRRIMAAALRTFDRRGIARTTMEHIAEAAGVTRGAIYWHFSGKEALLAAIREDVSLPLIDRADFTLLRDREKDPLDRIERFLLDVFLAVDEDSRTRLAFSVMSFKCEYVGSLESELDEYARKIERVRRQLTEVYSQAHERGELRTGLTPEIAALETTVFLAGLMRLCLLDDRGTSVRRQAVELIAAHVAGRRAASHHVSPALALMAQDSENDPPEERELNG
jgi:TetR/AcrR family transcriptional regulator, acrAB operon repressor